MPTAANRQQVEEPNDSTKAATLKESQEYPKELIKVTTANADKTTKVAVLVNNPINTDSSWDGLMSVESSKGNQTRSSTSEPNQSVDKSVKNPTRWKNTLF